MKPNKNEENGGPENDTAPRFHIEDSPATQDGSGTSGRSKYRPHSEQARFSERLRHEEETPPGGDGGPALLKELTERSKS